MKKTKGKKDLQKFYDCFSASGHYDIFSEHREEIKVLMDCFADSNKTTDAPDGYYYNEATETLIIFEHFEFDCSPAKKKGAKQSSTMRESESCARKQVDGEISALGIDVSYKSTVPIVQGKGVESICPTTGQKKITYNPHGDGGERERYVNNFIYIWNKHHEKIDEYKENIEKKIAGKIRAIKICFVVEDKTILGAAYRDSNGSRGELVNLLLTKQFIEIFENSNVDFVIFGGNAEVVIKHEHPTFIHQLFTNKEIEMVTH